MQKLKPTFKNNNCIVFSTNLGFLPYTAVMVESIIENGKDKNDYDIIILHNNIDNDSIKKFTSMSKGHKNVSIRFYDVNKFLENKTFYTANRKDITIETYFRLFIPWILSNDYKEALYIDADMVVVDDIHDIFKTKIGDNLIAAVRDYWGICSCYMPNDPRRNYRESIGLDNIDDYIIGGTLLFNLDKFREQYTIEYIIDLATSRNWLQHDQDVINILCKDKIKHITAKWGFIVDYGNNAALPQYLLDELDEAAKDLTVIHYGGPRKPWNNSFNYTNRFFWGYAKNTPYYDDILKAIKSKNYRNFVVNEIDKIKNTELKAELDKNHKELNNNPISDLDIEYGHLRIENGKLNLAGIIYIYEKDLKAKSKICIRLNDELIEVKDVQKNKEYRKDDNKLICEWNMFTFEHDISKYNKIELSVELYLDDKLADTSYVGFGKFSAFSIKKTNIQYAKFGKYIVTYNKNKFYIKKGLGFTNEIKLQLEALKSFRLKALLLRVLRVILKPFKFREIWLISDRRNKAADNGEVFFKYMVENHKNKNCYFLLNKNSTDYERLSKIGKVVEVNSYKHKLLSLLADVVISSQTDTVIRCPFNLDEAELFRGVLASTKFVFLQHGILYSDCSGWLNKYSKYFDGFVTGSKQEYDSVLNGKYYYNKENIWLIGLTRFDELKDNSKKVVTICPTWRKYLTIKQNMVVGNWNLISGFGNSLYVKTYRELMNNKKLNDYLDSKGYTLKFKMHTSFTSHKEDFQFDKEENIIDDEITYNQMYQESNLIITDYSSAITDFAYLKKPVLYFQFDRDEFFSNKHISSLGYFDYEKDGFGEVETTIDGIVDRIIEYVENDCKMKDKYLKRVDKFFKYNDKNNCERTYEKINDLLNK